MLRYQNGVFIGRSSNKVPFLFNGNIALFDGGSTSIKEVGNEKQES